MIDVGDLHGLTCKLVKEGVSGNRGTMTTWIGIAGRILIELVSDHNARAGGQPNTMTLCYEDLPFLRAVRDELASDHLKRQIEAFITVMEGHGVR